MKIFTEQDVRNNTIIATQADLLYEPLGWQKMGLQQTASGYGGKLTNVYKINFNGRLYRLYTTCYSNVGSVWFTVKGRKIYVN